MALYSGYSQPGASAVGQTFCRGVQMTDATASRASLRSIPGWYSGRITHIHFRVYLGNELEATSQLAFPQDITTEVYRSALYAARGQNTSVGTFTADNVFSDGEQYQLCAMRANAASGGYDAALTVGISRECALSSLRVGLGFRARRSECRQGFEMTLIATSVGKARGRCRSAAR